MFGATSRARSGVGHVLTSAPVSPIIQFNPGVYVWTIPPASQPALISGYRTDLDVHRSFILSELDTFGAEPKILGLPPFTGLQISTYWRAHEGDTAGDYSVGFPAWDAILNKAQSVGLKVMIKFEWRVDGGFGQLTDVFPSYLVNDGDKGISTVYHAPDYTLYSSMCARVWQAATADRVIAMVTALGARYNSHPALEMFSFGETAISMQNGVDGFSGANLLTQLKRILTATRAAFPNKGVRISTNDLYPNTGTDPDPLMAELVAHCVTQKIACGGPDVWRGDNTQGDWVFAGKNYLGDSVFPDVRDVIPWCSECQWNAFGGTMTLAQIWDAPTVGYAPGNGSFTIGSMKPRYFVWYKNEYNGTPALQWPSIRPFLIGKGGVTGFSNKPSAYP